MPHENSPPTSPTSPSFASPMKSANFNAVLHRLQKLSISTPSDPRSPLSPLGPPFALSDANHGAAGNFAPRPAPAYNLSPQSATSSGSEFSSLSSVSSYDAFDAFVRTQSRVVRLFNLPTMPQPFLASVFAQHRLAPTTMWVMRAPAIDFSVWAVFQSHREACAALSLSSTRMSVATALESDLEPFAKLKRFELVSSTGPPQLYLNNPQPTQRVLRIDSTGNALAGNASPAFAASHGGVPEGYTISSNPPNPRATFRPGDWICGRQNCSAMNFARNLTCIACACPRPNGSATAAHDAPQSPHHQHFSQSPPSRSQLSPRFAANAMQYPTNLSPTGCGFPPQQSSPTYGRYPSSSMQPVVNLPPPSSPTANKTMSAHPLLTPSGRAFASGGKVVNISSDPLNPCVMYWPENEPFPEQGQIRPSGLMGVPQPPILNTGNRGPISHQPGDWICLKCNYLNWRRRKVCQTCLPYAEGNGDSISAAVQAERIALLTSVLAQTRLASPPATPPHQQQSHQQQSQQQQQHPHLIGRSHSTTPAQAHRRFVNFSPPPPSRGPVHRSQSHSELGSQYTHGYPIYQTSPHQNQHHHQQPQYSRHYSSPLQRHTLSIEEHPIDLYAPAPLLPSFLQDIVQSPTLSPASTSSADLSFEEYDEESLPSSTRSTFSQSGGDSVHSSPLANIWRLDGEESKSLSSFPPLPTARQGLIRSATSSRNSSLERLRAQVSLS
ncbi:hypothetical protein B0H16DRAFT_1503599 [Mycena metata]|uniref:RanBP2-type domain-containing protein n=1 Tax=Mycena metata TaxID=1033252 RepID=A0AAD7K5A1_9AGAR|nr:hypothetical protein B0H16DRAFT_1503599 [Mycena metata]